MEIGIFDVQVESFSRDLALAHVRRGYGHYRTGDLTAALSEFLEAKRLCPDDPYVHYLLGKTLARFGRPREAQAALKASLALCPRFLDAHYQLGRAYLAEKDANVHKALKAFEGEIAIYSAHAEAHRAIAKIHRLLGNKAAATESRRRAAMHGYRRRVAAKTPLKSVC